MKINNLSFITPIKKTINKKIVLEKSYSQKLTLQNGDKIFLASKIGKRETQQDCIAITQNGDYLMLLISDGMGGMKDGEQASYTTASIIKQWLDSEDKEMLKLLSPKSLEDVLNALTYFISINIPNNSGATLSMSIITPTKTIIVNIGDSRTYIIKNKKITLITQDDSIVFKKYKPMNKEERDILRFHKENNIITNSISKNQLPSINIITINNDDYDILCHLTDGVTDILEETLIELYLQSENPAIKLVNKSTTGKPLQNPQELSEFNKRIYPGKDNSSAIVYTKKRVR